MQGEYKLGRILGANRKPINAAQPGGNYGYGCAYNHGLGDCVFFAFLSQLYLNRGNRVRVRCPQDKEWFFKACGLTIDPTQNQHHPWPIPRSIEPTYFNDWEGNKIAENILRPFPFPHLGDIDFTWNELLGVRLNLQHAISDSIREETLRWVEGLNRPIYLTHTRGRTCQENKNIAHYQNDMFAALVDSGATVVHLDWDRASPDYEHPAIVDGCINDMTLEKLAALIYEASAFIGIDSGPCHLARINYDLPTLQVWTKHSPAHYALPRPNLVALTDTENPTRKWTPLKRHAFNIVEVNQLSGQLIAEHALQMLEPRTFTPGAGRDAVIWNLLAKMYTPGVPYRNAYKSFANFLTLLPDTPTILELDGFSANGITSSYVLGLYCDTLGGSLKSLKVEEPTPFKCVSFHQPTNRLEWLSSLAPRTEFWLRTPPFNGVVIGQSSAEQAFAELKAVEPYLSHDCVILVDECPFSCRPLDSGEIKGTGRLVVPYLIENGWKTCEVGSQCVLTRQVTCGA